MTSQTSNSETSHGSVNEAFIMLERMMMIGTSQGGVRFSCSPERVENRLPPPTPPDCYVAPPHHTSFISAVMTVHETRADGRLSIAMSGRQSDGGAPSFSHTFFLSLSGLCLISVTPEGVKGRPLLPLTPPQNSYPPLFSHSEPPPSPTQPHPVHLERKDPPFHDESADSALSPLLR